MDGSNTGEIIAPDLNSITITLEEAGSRQPTSGQGHQVYAAFLNILGVGHPLIAKKLHDMDSIKPFTISTLHRKMRPKANGEQHTLQVTFLQGSYLAYFLDSALNWGSTLLQVGNTNYKIVEIDTFGRHCKDKTFSRYQDLLVDADSDKHIKLGFFSPTTFRSGGKRNVLFPEPALVFNSYLARWLAFSPVPLEEDVFPWFEHILVSRYRLHTGILDYGSYQEIGFEGWCIYEIGAEVPGTMVKTLNALADFARFCGTGAKTTMGMGQTRRMPLVQRTHQG